MTRGFYEQIGIQSDADLDEIKAAYGRAVAHLLKRREATVVQGGDTAALDLARDQLNEAWTVLSDPARRRRYDAMLAVAGDGLSATDVEDLWSRVAGAMIHPAVAAAARIVDAATTLRLGPLPEPPRPTPGRRTTSTTVAESAPATPRALAGFGAPRQVRRPAEAAAPPAAPAAAPAQVVAAAPAIQMPTTPSVNMAALPDLDDVDPYSTPLTSPTVVPTASTGDVDQLVDQLGYGGGLLRAMRERAGLSIQEMSDTTRISATYLEAVEREDFGALPPAPAFVRGYVREMSRMLGLDVDRVVAGYMRRFSADG